MKISEAMRKGAKMGPQLFGMFGDGTGGSCGQGAIALGAGLATSETLMPHLTAQARKLLKEYFPELRSISACPACPVHLYVDEGIVHLNDHHKWTRERIAGWIEAQVEVPTYSLLDMQHYMEGADEREEVCVR